MTHYRSWVSRTALALGLLALAAGPAAAQDSYQDQGYQDQYQAQDQGPAGYPDDTQAAQPDGGSYGYIRIIEGAATIQQAGTGARTPADTNQPLMAGDHLWVPDRSHVELVLADRNLVRVDGGSELVLEHLAASPDANDAATVLRLLEGNLQLVVTRESLGDQLPRLETPNASILPQDFGVYRVTTDQGSWSEVVVRRGKAEVDTDNDSQIANADQMAVVEGARLGVAAATGYDNLERWAQRLDQDASVEMSAINEDLRYQAAPLAQNGSWVNIEGEDYWRPRGVAADWRPYSEGRWEYTPSGMTWVSYESWGWVPYHYGSWDFFPTYGWVWRPGYVYSPAWVYWYWGPSYTGWCPVGYYTHYYNARLGFPGFHLGVYGWAGGDWGGFANWTFVPSRYFQGYRDGYRNGAWNGRQDAWRQHWDVRHYAVPVDQLRRGGALPRGIITTDTRPLRPETLGDPQRALRVLADHPTARRIGQGGQLADVTPFIARRTDLSPTVRTAVSAGGDVHRLDGTPLRPSTLGRPGPRVVPMAPGQGGRTAGPRVVPRAVPDNRPGAPGTPRVVPSNPNPDRYGRRYQTGDRGGAPRPDSGPRVVPSNPDRGRPADRRQQNDRGGAPRPDSGPRVVPSNPTPDRGRPADRGQQNDRGGAPRPDSGPRVVPSNPNRERPADRGQQNDRGNTNNDRPQRARPAPENDRTPPPARLQTYGGDNPGYRAPQGRSDRSYGYGNDRGYQRPAYDPPRVVAPRYTPPPAPRAARPAPPPRRQSPPPAPPQHKEKQRDNRDHGDGH